MSSLNIGDLLLRPKAIGITHVGVWLGGGAVFHNAPETGEHVSTWDAFTAGEKVIHQTTHANASDVLKRARAKLVSPRRYDLFLNNCEHSATEVVTGRPFSRQLQVFVAVLCVTGALALLVLRKSSSH